MTPTERTARIVSYGSAYDTLVAALKQFSPEAWHYRAAHDPWTIHEIVVHIADSEANSFVRCRRAIAEPGSGVWGYDEMTWAHALRYEEQSAADALELFKWLRGNTHKLIRTLPDATWTHTIEHSENGTLTLDDWLVAYADHVPDHIAQMRRIYDAWHSRQ